MHINIESEAMTRENLIDHILNGNFCGENFHRYSIEMSEGSKLIATRFVREGEYFAITFVVQEDIDGSWEDVDGKYIEFIKGDINNIHEIITNEAYYNIVPTMQKNLIKKMILS